MVECRNKTQTRRDDVARRGYKARHALYDLNKKLNKRIREEENEHRLAEIYSVSCSCT
jgi:hypothetical protein